MRPVFALVFAIGCGSQATPDSGLGPFDAPLAIDAPVDAAPDAPIGGPTYRIHLTATHAEATHDPATSGQQPREWFSGIRSLHLLRNMSDPNPVLVFSHGDGYVEASYADGADTVVGSTPLRSIPPGEYQVARVVHTHVRCELDATMHSPLGTAPGVIRELVVLSDRTTVDSMAFMHGHYRFVFSVAGMDYPAEGNGFVIPEVTSGGFTVRVENGETAYYFPAPVQVDPSWAEDIDLIFEVNVHEGFRWMDQDMAGYEDGVFDVTPTSTEPIMQFGANRYRIIPVR